MGVQFPGKKAFRNTLMAPNTTDEDTACDDLWISGCTHYIVIKMSVVCVHDAVYKPPGMYTYVCIYIYIYNAYLYVLYICI